MDSSPASPKSLLKPILVGGIAAGFLDASLAVKEFGWGMARGIASGLLGKRAFDHGTGTWVLGISLHFLIALSAAAIYCASSRRMKFLRTHYIFGGLFYGVTVYLFMNLVVVPLSAFPFPVGPFSASGLRSDLVTFMIIIGLPISMSLRLFSAEP